MKLHLTPSKSFYHHYAEPILSTLEFGGDGLKEAMVQALTVSWDFTEIVRSAGRIKRPGIPAQEVNEALRDSMKASLRSGVEFEVKERNGYWEWGDKKEGFDFGLLDHVANLYQLRNACFGRRPLHGGGALWESYLTANPVYAELATTHSADLGLESVGQNVTPPMDVMPPVVGEIQLGNHALRGVDMFRLMKAHRTSEVGLVIYVAATGKLESYLSSGIVTFDVMRDFLIEFDREVNAPIWLVGLDCMSIYGDEQSI